MPNHPCAKNIPPSKKENTRVGKRRQHHLRNRPATSLGQRYRIESDRQHHRQQSGRRDGDRLGQPPKNGEDKHRRQAISGARRRQRVRPIPTSNQHHQTNQQTQSLDHGGYRRGVPFTGGNRHSVVFTHRLPKNKDLLSPRRPQRTIANSSDTIRSGRKTRTPLRYEEWFVEHRHRTLSDGAGNLNIRGVRSIRSVLWNAKRRSTKGGCFLRWTAVIPPNFIRSRA